MTPSAADILLIVLVMGLSITAFTFGLIYLISNVGGWGALARDHAVSPETHKGALLEEKPQRRAWVGSVRFGGMVTASCFENGVELQAGFPFSPPLFFRWDEISEYQLVHSLPFPQMAQFTVEGRRIRLSNRLLEMDKRKGRG